MRQQRLLELLESEIVFQEIEPLNVALNQLFLGLQFNAFVIEGLVFVLVDQNGDQIRILRNLPHVDQFQHGDLGGLEKEETEMDSGVLQVFLLRRFSLGKVVPNFLIVLDSLLEQSLYVLIPLPDLVLLRIALAVDEVEHPGSSPPVLNAVDELPEGLVFLVQVKFLLEAMFEEKFGEVEFPSLLCADYQDVEEVHLPPLALPKDEGVVDHFRIAQEVLLKHGNSLVAVIIRLVFSLGNFAFGDRNGLFLRKTEERFVFLEVLGDGYQGVFPSFIETFLGELHWPFLGIFAFGLGKQFLTVEVRRELLVMLLLQLSFLLKRSQNGNLGLVHVPEERLLFPGLLHRGFSFLHLNYSLRYSKTPILCH